MKKIICFLWLSLIIPTLFFAQNAIPKKQLDGDWVWAGTECSNQELETMMEGISLRFHFYGDSSFLQEIYYQGEFIEEETGKLEWLEQGRKLLITPDRSKESITYTVDFFDGQKAILAEKNEKEKYTTYYTFYRLNALKHCTAYSLMQRKGTICVDDKYIFSESNLQDTLFVAEGNKLYEITQYKNDKSIFLLEMEGQKIYTNPLVFTKFPKSVCGEINSPYISRIDVDIEEPAGFWQAKGDCNAAMMGALMRAGIY